MQTQADPEIYQSPVCPSLSSILTRWTVLIPAGQSSVLPVVWPITQAILQIPLHLIAHLKLGGGGKKIAAPQSGLIVI